MNELNDKQKMFLKLLKDGAWHSPTELGMAAGKDYGAASGYASSTLKALVGLGKVERSPRGQYRLKK